jgi:hypothetical protein
VIAVGLVGGCYGPQPPLGAPCTSSASCPLPQMCFAGRCVDHPQIDAPITRVDTPIPIDAPARTPTSCREIHAADPTAASGTFTIDPDGSGGDPPLDVTCDMTTADGGWALVFLSPTANEAAVPIAYTSATPRLLADATEVLLAFRQGGSSAALPNSAVLALPTAWQTVTPFDDPGTDLTTTASIDGAAPIAATLRYGSSNFSTLCSDDWVSTSAFGRICLDGTTGPFYSGFNTVSSDRCATSDQAFNAQSCTPDRVFSIAVR